MSHIQIISGDKKWKMHELLVNNLKLIKKHNANDWDFKMLISGDGMTRTGKSTIASQIAQYLDPTFAENYKDRMIFDGEKLIDIAYTIGKNKALVYDEAKAGLDSKKQMEQYTKKLLDFFSQCGSLNHMLIVVLPEYFELPKSIAMTQSIFLLNCYARNGFERGYFEFYNRKDKRYLYVKGTKYFDYTSQRPTFKGTFTNYVPFNRKTYEALKSETLNKIRKRENVGKIKEEKDLHKNRVRLLIKHLMQDYKEKPALIAEKIGVASLSLLLSFLRFLAFLSCLMFHFSKLHTSFY